MIKVCPTCDQKFPEDTEFCAKDGTRLEELQDETEDRLVGKALDGRWVIQERIGEGGMGAVYLASQRSVDRQVAIKTLRPELCNSREFVDRFFREARVASTIAHPHCVTILDFGQTDDGTLYLAMEYLEGMPLADRLRHPDLSVREILQICMQISSALGAAHQQNIIHRDLKPDNVFMLSISDGSTFIKVLDFGIAKVLDAEEEMTKTGQVFGTPEYMSPEQCRGDKLDGRSDLYSLGCILYRMLSGHPPFESDTPMAVLVSHASENPPHINEVIQRSDIPDGLTELCMQLLAKQPDQRPPDAQAVRAKLEAMMGHTTSGPTPAVSGSMGAAPSGPQSEPNAEGTGPTMAADSDEVSSQSGPLAADGGSAQQQAPGSGQQQAPGSGQQQAAPSRAQASSGHTAAQDTFANEKKSSLPLIFGVGIAVLLAAGCTIGAIYAAYTYLGSDSDDGGVIASLLGGDEAEQNSDENVDDGDGDEPAIANGADDEPDDSDDELAQKDSSKSQGDGSGDDSDGAKPADSDKDNNGGAPSDDGSKMAGADEKEDDKDAKQDDEKSDDKQGTTTKVEINADKAEVAVNTKTDDSKKDKDDGSKSSDTKAKTDTKKDKEEPPPEKPGNIRQTALSASGSACITPNVERVERGARSRFLSCYSDALGADPELKGKVMLAFNISTDGSVITPEILVSEASPVDSCFLGALSSLNFDPPSGGRCYVRLTYQLTP